MYHQRKNPRKIAWTQLYRKQHKKGTQETAIKKKSRRSHKVERAIVGASLEAIQAKRTQKPEDRQANREAALKKVKEKRKKEQDVKRAAKGAEHPKKAEKKASVKKAAKTEKPKAAGAARTKIGRAHV